MLNDVSSIEFKKSTGEHMAHQETFETVTGCRIRVMRKGQGQPGKEQGSSGHRITSWGVKAL